MSDPSNLVAWIGAATGAAALAITWWKTVRDARAEQPVLWLLSPEKTDAPAGAKHPVNYSVKLTPAFADAHNFKMGAVPPGRAIDAWRPAVHEIDTLIEDRRRRGGRPH